jgi:hypothetical protein
VKPADPYDQLLYWCDCQAATLGYLVSLKSTSKSRAERQLNIARGMLETTRSVLNLNTPRPGDMPQPLESRQMYARWKEQAEHVEARINNAVMSAREDRGWFTDEE